MKRCTRNGGSKDVDNRRNGLLGVTAIILGLGVVGFTGFNANALNYMKDVNVQFTFNDAIRVSVSDPNLVINDLSPGTASDSNIITVNVLSNNPYGYTLTSNVGNSTTFNTDELRHTTSATATPFSTITAGTTVSDLSGFTNNQWGYSYSLDGGTTWINDSGNTGYSGLPLYSVGEATLNEKTTTSAAAGDNIEFKIAAKAASTQLSGEYQNIINFIATGAPAPPSCQSTISGTMQDFNPCDDIAIGTTGTLTDSRDSEEYLVGKLADGNYWMLDNLRLDPTAVDLATLQGNTNASNTTLGYLKNGGGTSPYTTTAVSNAWTSSSQNSYDLPYINASRKDGTVTSYGSGSGKVGVYYNYCAASAGSYCYASGAGTGNASEDLCPAGWRMPTGSNNGEYQALYAAYSSNATNFRNALSTPLSGYFSNGSAYYLGSYGYFWSSTYYNGSSMYRLLVYSSGVVPSDGGNRLNGVSLRCLLSS